MNEFSIVIGLLGITPIIYEIYIYLGKYRPSNRFIGFSVKEPLDVIITTSTVTPSYVGAKVTRATTGIGQVKGIAFLSKFIGRNFLKKDINIYMSSTENIRPVNDLVLLGGPAKNKYSEHFLNKFIEKNPHLNLEVNDRESRLKIHDQEYNIDDLNISGKFPQKDIGIVIVCENPFSANDRRAIYCAGMTSYGTSGCAMWLFDDILIELDKQAKTLFKDVGKKSPNFVTVLEMEIINGGVASIDVIASIPLKK